jgi:hypothetical protein
MNMPARWITPTAGAIVFGSVHALIVALPVISTWGNGEGQAFAVAIFDAPLVALLSLFAAGRSLLYDGPSWVYVGVFAIGGTLLYCGAGAVVGFAVQRLIRAVRRRGRDV